MGKIKSAGIILFILTFLFSACTNISSQRSSEDINRTATQVITPTQTITPSVNTHEFPWWNDVVFYEIFVRSFYDSDGDGNGDIQGIISKLDYLNDGNPETKNDLGITGIWLMPVFPSTSYHGYDVVDYRAVNTDYGSMDDMNELLEEAHKRGIKVIIDFVINHTSVDHPWFKEARADKESQYRNWYLWSDEDKTYLGPWGQDVWHFNYDNSYYYGVFWSGMPDLNFKNPDVTNEVYDIADFWLSDIGVDGFRIDGALHLIEDGEVQKNTQATHTWFKEFYQHYKEINPEAFTVGEVWDSNFLAVKYVKEKEFDLVFDFEQSEALMEGVMGSDGQRVLNALEFNYELYPKFQKANFLTNHDMNRVMHVFQGDENKAKIAAVLLLSAPGVPFIYYGEEIGMVGSKPDENIRLPMQWDGNSNAGFTTGVPWRAGNPNFSDWNVDVLSKQDNSLLNLYRQLIHLRNETSALRVGEFQKLTTNDRNVVAFSRILDNEKILVLINLGKEPKEVTVELPRESFNSGNYSVNSLLENKIYSSLSIVEGDNPTIYQPKPSMNGSEYLILKITP